MGASQSSVENLAQNAGVKHGVGLSYHFTNGKYDPQNDYLPSGQNVRPTYQKGDSKFMRYLKAAVNEDIIKNAVDNKVATTGDLFIAQEEHIKAFKELFQ